MKRFSLLLVSILTAALNGFSQKNAYDIKVKLQGGPPEKYVHLAHFFGYNQYIKIDSAKLENGYYNFVGEEPLKGGIYLIVLSPSKYYDFAVNGLEKAFTIEADTTDFVKTVKVTGSKENELLFKYRKFLKEKSDEAAALSKSVGKDADQATKEAARAKMTSMQKEVNQYMKDFVKDNKGTFAAEIIQANFEPEIPTEIPRNSDGSKDSTFAFRYYKTHYWDNINFTDDRILRTPFLQTKLEKYFKDLVYQIQDSVMRDSDHIINLSKKNKEVYRYVLWWVTNKYENVEIVGLDGVFVHLAEDYYLKDADWLDSTQRAKFQERVSILKPLRTGEVFPQLIVADTLGRETTVMANNAKYTIVYFYSPDCGHCKDSAPKLVEFNEKNATKGIMVYNVSVDHDLPKMKEFIKKYNTGKMINVWDSQGRYYFRNRYDVYSTPTSYILDAQKRIIGKRIPIEEFSRFIEFHEKQQERQKNSK